MAEPDDSAFSRVLCAFRSRLSLQDINAFRYTTFDDLKQTISDIQKEQAQRRGLRNLNKIRPFLNGLGQYAQVIEVFVNAKPDILAFVWGPIKLCLQIASRLTEAFDALLDAYEKIGKSFPIFSTIDRLFLSNTHVQQVLADVYEDILDFHKRAIIFFRQSAWRLAFKVTLHTFGDMFGDVTKKLERSKELLLQSANVAHFHEAQEARLIFSRKVEALTERTKKDRMLAVVDWLSPTLSYVDHEELQEKRREFPDTTRWILEESSMRDWLRIERNANSMFWICGIPGAGKTVLFSSIVDEIKATIPVSQVVYFYCKNRDPTKSSFHEVARSLIAQLLRLNPISLDYLYDLAVESGERHPSTFKTYQDILENISTTHNLLFIGIDGLDECEETERRSILSLMQHILKVSSHQANVKIFLTSQRVPDVELSLKSAIRFDIKHRHVKQDIQNYVHRRSSQLCKKFGYSLAKQKSLIKDISARPEGMFLLARLILDNLMDQDSIEDLERELCTDTLPKGIDEAYGRILLRLRRGRAENSQQRITRVLEIILTARRPLKIHELQGALSIHIQAMNVDFSKRRSLVPFGELCGPLVEVHADDVVSLVHPTAKQYLTQHHSGPYIGMLGAEIRMANLCATYLTFGCFSTNLQEKLFREHVTAGAFAFQEYATLNWLYHLNSLSDTETGNDDGELASLDRACQLLKLRHCEFLSTQVGVSNPGTGQQGRHISRQVFARLQACYEAVHSISDSDECYDSLPFLLQLVARARFVVEELLLAGQCRPASLVEAYGASVFKCSILACPWFQHGFNTNKLRNEHRNKHQGRVYCIHEGCDYSTLGYSSKAELAKHLFEHESQPSEISFPMVQRSSLTKSLEDAIDQNDFLSVGSLSMEVSALPSRDSGFLLRAVKKGSLEALKALIPNLGTGEDLNSRDRLGKTVLHLVAENGNDEMARLIIQMGPNVDAEVRREDKRFSIVHKYTPLMIAASRGHSTIVKLLLDQGAQDLEMCPSSGKTSLQLAAQVYAKHEAYVNAIRSAASKNHESAIRLLLERGHELNAEQKYTQALRTSLRSGIEATIAQMVQQIDSKGKTKGNALQLAASKGKTEEVLRLLEAGADINHSSSGHGTALAAAAHHGDLSLVQLLLDKGANVNIRGGYKGTALQQAAYKGHEAVLSLLLKHGADLDLRRRHLPTALQVAVSTKKEAIVSLLLKHTHHQTTALHQAVSENNEASLSLLLRLDADVNFLSYRETALHRAAREGKEAMVLLLLKNGADVNVKDLSGRTALQIAIPNGNKGIISVLLKYGSNVNAKDSREHNVLQLAVAMGQLEIVSLLLEQGVNMQWGSALRKAAEKGHEAMVRLLLASRRLVEDGALQIAAFNDHEATVSLLLQQEANVDHVADVFIFPPQHPAALKRIVSLLRKHVANVDLATGQVLRGTALQLATCNDHDAIVRLLLEHGAGVNFVAKDALEATALQLATSNGNETIVRLLIEHGANINAKYGFMGTALHQAVGNGHQKTVSLLLEQEVDVNVTCNAYLEGQSFTAITPFQVAAEFGHEGIVDLLLRHGADFNGGYGETALEKAKRLGYEGIVNLLSAKGESVDAGDGISGELQSIVNDDQYNLFNEALDNGDVREVCDFDSLLQSTDDGGFTFDLSALPSGGGNDFQEETDHAFSNMEPGE